MYVYTSYKVTTCVLYLPTNYCRPESQLINIQPISDFTPLGDENLHILAKSGRFPQHPTLATQCVHVHVSLSTVVLSI